MKIIRVKGKDNPIAKSFQEDIPKFHKRSDLKSCPFCGNESPEYDEESETIICGGCCVEFFNFFAKAGEEESMVKIWNTRK